MSLHRRELLLLLLALRLLCQPLVVPAASDTDISDTRRLIFVADRTDPVIDIIDPDIRSRIYRLETPTPVDGLIITPDAPLLLYTTSGQAMLYAYNLRKKQWLPPLKLPFLPDDLVLDSGGSKIGITNSSSGGFVLVSAYTQEILLQMPGIPATGPVLFDPNDIDIYYTSDASGSLGLIDTNLQRAEEIPLVGRAANLSAPSRSLDGRYLYVTDYTNGELYNLNAFSKVIHKTFAAGTKPVRPYTTPEGLFLYVLDSASGQWTAFDQNRFEAFTTARFPLGTDLVAVGRQDRMNVFASSGSKNFTLYDNASKGISRQGSFEGTPLDIQGSVNGETAIVVFSDLPQVALLDLASGAVQYIEAGNNGAAALGLGASNNVCH